MRTRSITILNLDEEENASKENILTDQVLNTEMQDQRGNQAEGVEFLSEYKGSRNLSAKARRKRV